MAEPFVAEIRIFAGGFAPQGWALCDGQLIQVAQNPALFSLLATTYGGDGRETFGLPNLRGRFPMHAGWGPGLSVRRLGETGGGDTVAITAAQMPGHNHSLRVVEATGDVGSPGPDASLANSSAGDPYQSSEPASTALDPRSLADAGGSRPHNNLQPYLVMNFIIALTGIYPPRT